MAKITFATAGRGVEEAVRLLRQGELVCYPTDTVYGLAAAAGNAEAVRKVFAAKERSPDKAMPLLIAAAEDAPRLAEVTPRARALMDRFWPGALTIVMRVVKGYSSVALAQQGTVALRVPDHAVIQEIIRALGEPITGTSANRAGAPPPLSAAETALQMGEAVSLVVDGGPCPRGRESTVIDITGDAPRLLRDGAVSREEIEKALGQQVE